ncbi:G-type lectin S-receptor-like serine/threonine-protein kinase At4g27290 [Bidens hawaiensis]|uniref:G-type lectin S-receptor-like serine/threonine-protein kinase At4g27290 n=1 Tax=Bidens hawaiensis TaxID=980011 RepID=UPI0040498AE3
MEGAYILLFFLLFLHKSYAAVLHIISDSSFLTDRDTLVSPARIFELGFFKPGSSENRYLGIWYKNISIRKVVWVANRDYPLLGTSPLVLKIVDQGILGLFNNISLIWSSNTTTLANVTAKLQDNGNLVVIDQDSGVIWQSFDYPTDTLLPGMKLGRDLLRGKEWHLSSWKSSQDPAPGEFTLGADAVGYPEYKIKHRALVKVRNEPWANQLLCRIVIGNKSLAFTYDVIIQEVSKGQLEFFWATREMVVGRRWQSINMTQQSCACLDEKRFVPKNPKGWETGDWSSGCIRRAPLECKNGIEGFIKYSNLKLPDTEYTWFDMNMTLEECHTKCLQNCTCMAYANPDNTRSICLFWFSDLLDIVQPDDIGGRDIFVRMASTELGNNV